MFSFRGAQQYRDTEQATIHMNSSRPLLGFLGLLVEGVEAVRIGTEDCNDDSCWVALTQFETDLMYPPFRLGAFLTRADV
jgi:hypothetical protein